MRKWLAVSLILLALIVNTLNFIFYSLPGYERLFGYAIHYTWYETTGGVLGITVLPAGIAGLVAAAFSIRRANRHKFLFYFSVIFLLLSLALIFISYSVAAFEK